MSLSSSVLTSRGSRRTILTSGKTSSSIIQKAVRFESIVLGIVFPVGEGLMITGGFENGKFLIFNERLSS